MSKRQSQKELETSGKMSDKKSKTVKLEKMVAEEQESTAKVPETTSKFPSIEDFGGELQNSRSK